MISQNTVGTITSSTAMYDGLTLFTPNASTETYLIDNCGRVVNQWSSTYQPANSVYLLENGNLLRTGKIINSQITFGGVGGHIQLYDWDNNLLWEYTYSSPVLSQHHDIYPLPNGNILMLAVNTMTQAQAIQAGRNPSLLLNNKIYNEHILELEPVGTNSVNIVWEWNIKDHLIQDFDSSKDNFGVVGDHPELLDFNYLNGNNGNANWLHINSIQYNNDLDQIILSSRLMDEIYIIDHSTTTAEASSHSGGLYGKGGDFLYRWGNPEAYDKGDSTDKTLFSQHYPHWIPNGLVDAGKIMVFNNGNSIRYSTVNIFSPPMSSPGVYIYDPVNGYGPSGSDWVYTDPVDPSNFFSAILSSAQRLPNGNTLICDGDSGYFFEIDPSNNIVWEYINPDSADGILSQGETSTQNLVFRAFKYALDYPAFTGRDLTPGDPIEINPDLINCENLSINESNINNIKIYPNPTSKLLTFDFDGLIERIDIIDMMGTLIITASNVHELDISHLNSGVYFLRLEIDKQFLIKKIIKK
ncbi:aryl-sulfate sulfotransferase [Subsaxibacter sp. CAU 1640]|uniref:aryl-sulfate sulfotransferase n=1 Tax=Subsaxibacter sp. CAU 1640 TaxID=2933271 RepID=UPI00200698E2|nr:aryl-sulfate sulfotransferase [Subsaxibacter sp. CAU 1640]MCK7591943.1 aryl-sulfate sulfotransferase [Subsaxibacter sp. CAU 1640]